MENLKIDINCDIGEGTDQEISRDGDLMALVSSCNISCGFHAGEPWVIERAVDMAIRRGMRIGAHPSYMDKANFGRKEMDVDPDQLRSVLKYQIAMLKGLMESKGAKLHYVKPHGALYNQMAADEELSEVVVAAILEIDASLKLMGLADSVTEQVAQEFGIKFIREAFIDRAYLADGSLCPRSEKGAVIEDPEVAFEQLKNMIINGQVSTIDGKKIMMSADSFCIHGDNPAAPKILRYIHDQMNPLGYQILA